ncbi:MAG: HDOD domain-containing protein [Melioribacteraceae bacterium]|nr:MAG: HDOD domain-containing protein [Melioribacteraceae bacterium]
MTNTDKILEKIKELPTLPTVFSRLSDAMSNPRITNDEIAEIISSDQAAALKVLKVVNSAFYGFSGRIDTISRAILYLGLNEVRNLIFALSVINLFQKKKNLMNFRPAEFWSHSIAVGITARIVGSTIQIPNLENYFLAGILHDIGKLILFEHASDEYGQILQMVEEKRCSISNAEKEVLGFDHAKIGELLALKWNLPSTIRNAVRYHHGGVMEGSTDKLVAAVYIADITARTLELGYPGDDLIPEPNELVFEKLKIPENFFTNHANEILKNYEETTKLLLSD